MIYCVEDDRAIRELVVYTLQNTGLSARGFGESTEFFAALAKEKPKLILLDIMLPMEDGISILKKLRLDPSTRNLPIIMVTAKSTEYDKVMALDIGADDYMTKPFGIMELVARIKALLRRTGEEKREDSALHYGPIVMDKRSHSLFVDNVPVELTLKEFELLHLFMGNPGIAFTRDVLLEKIWGYDFDGETRTVDVHVRTLRHKLGKAAKYIETVRGVGYRMGGNA